MDFVTRVLSLARGKYFWVRVEYFWAWVKYFRTRVKYFWTRVIGNLALTNSMPTTSCAIGSILRSYWGTRLVFTATAIQFIQGHILYGLNLVASLWTWWKMNCSLWTYKCHLSKMKILLSLSFLLLFLFYLSQIAYKTSQIESTMVTCLHYLII